MISDDTRAKLGSINKNCRVRGPSQRVPLRTIHELAEELGVNHQSLTHWMRADPQGPRPAVQSTRHSASGHKTYYNPKEVRAWFTINGDKVMKSVNQPESPKP